MTDAPDNSVHPLSRAEWRDWLTEHHVRDQGVWLISYKKATGKPRAEYNDAVEEAICFGWVDSKTNGLAENRSMLWFAPRRTGSAWSRSNKDRFERMMEAGLMAQAGLEKIEVAKQDGSWSILDSVEALEIPPDLAAAFAVYDDAAGNFDAFPRAVKRNILEWITIAKRSATRAKRIEETARLAQDNIRANQWSRNP